ncbi:hypothetical protein COCVIDRAFT_30381 [Bipolaris victoriae FI3]|uniref:Cullin N-terminal domain-containing protein n=1 Tax=Bipolaris victoriae (strain FI3) TaxID=930091 RepID=W7E6A1_BIPV3|nr:hypothetical protein COCVIDRAFT_30381 [Bipolaris victoriae FI3]
MDPGSGLNQSSKDPEATWNDIKPGLDNALKYHFVGWLRASTADEAFDKFCTQDPKGGQAGEPREIYNLLNLHLKTHLEEVWKPPHNIETATNDTYDNATKSVGGNKTDGGPGAEEQEAIRDLGCDTDEVFLEYYDRSWQDYEDAMTYVRLLFDQLLILRWREALPQKFQERLKTLLFNLIQAHRNHTKIRRVEEPDDTQQLHEAGLDIQVLLTNAEINRLPLIKSKSDFEDPHIKSIISYYEDEVAAIHAKSDSLEKVHWFLNRLSVEKDILPDTASKPILLPVLMQCHETFRFSEIWNYYTSRPYFTNPFGGSQKFMEKVGLRDHDDMVNILTGNKSALNNADSKKRTALHCAVLANNLTLINSLLKLGAWPGAQDHRGQTPGHLAVVSKSLLPLNALLKHSACCSVCNNERKLISELIRDLIDSQGGSDPSWEKAQKLAMELQQDAWLFDTHLDDQDIEQEFQPTVVAYQYGLWKTSKISSLGDLLSSEDVYAAHMKKDAAIKWLHLPTNNMRWIEMPYVYWEYTETFESMSRYASACVTQSEPVDTTGSSIYGISLPHQQLMRLYMRSGTDKFGRSLARQLHLRRSLDQYCYHALPNTSYGDKDQLVSRMHAKGTLSQNFPGRLSKGQLDDIPDKTDVLENVKGDPSQIETHYELASRIVYNCLTSCLDPGTNDATNLQFLEFYDTEIGRIADRETTLFREFSLEVNKQRKEDEPTASTDGNEILSQYEVDIPGPRIKTREVAHEIELLEQIKDIQDELHALGRVIGDQKTVVNSLDQVNSSTEPDASKEPNRPKSKPPKKHSTPSKHSSKSWHSVIRYEEQVKNMTIHADRTYDALSKLVDLKQKFANVQEARIARKQAEATLFQARETAKQGEIAQRHAKETAAQGKEAASQGRTLMVFTILLLSFMTSFFALQIDEFPWIDVADGWLSLNWLSSIMFPVSFGFSILLMAIAWNIDTISNFFAPKYRTLTAALRRKLGDRMFWRQGNVNKLITNAHAMTFVEEVNDALNSSRKLRWPLHYGRASRSHVPPFDREAPPCNQYQQPIERGPPIFVVNPVKCASQPSENVCLASNNDARLASRVALDNRFAPNGIIGAQDGTDV